MPSQDVRKFTPVSYRTSALWGRCPALTLLLQLIIPSRASGTADHVQSLDDLFSIFPSYLKISTTPGSSMLFYLYDCLCLLVNLVFVCLCDFPCFCLSMFRYPHPHDFCAFLLLKFCEFSLPGFIPFF